MLKKLCIAVICGLLGMSHAAQAANAAVSPSLLRQGAGIVKEIGLNAGGELKAFGLGSWNIGKNLLWAPFYNFASPYASSLKSQIGTGYSNISHSTHTRLSALWGAANRWLSAKNLLIGSAALITAYCAWHWYFDDGFTKIKVKKLADAKLNADGSLLITKRSETGPEEIYGFVSTDAGKIEKLTVPDEFLLSHNPDGSCVTFKSEQKKLTIFKVDADGQRSIVRTIDTSKQFFPYVRSDGSVVMAKNDHSTAILVRDGTGINEECKILIIPTKEIGLQIKEDSGSNSIKITLNNLQLQHNSHEFKAVDKNQVPQHLAFDKQKGNLWTFSNQFDQHKQILEINDQNKKFITIFNPQGEKIALPEHSKYLVFSADRNTFRLLKDKSYGAKFIDARFTQFENGQVFASCDEKGKLATVIVAYTNRATKEATWWCSRRNADGTLFYGQEFRDPTGTIQLSKAKFTSFDPDEKRITFMHGGKIYTVTRQGNDEEGKSAPQDGYRVIASLPRGLSENDVTNVSCNGKKLVIVGKDTIYTKDI